MPMKSSATSSTLTNNLNAVVQEFLDWYKKVATMKNLVSEISDPQSLDGQVALMALFYQLVCFHYPFFEHCLVTDLSLVQAREYHQLTFRLFS